MTNKVKGLVRKYANKAIRYVKKRYIGKGYTVKIGRMMKDVEHLKGVINSELKEFILQVGSDPVEVGQFNGASTAGNYVYDITPFPAQGLTDITRNGDSIRPKYCEMQFQIYQMTATIQPLRGRIVFFKIPGAPITASTIVNDYFTSNVWTNAAAIVDYHSKKDPDYSGIAKKIFEKRFYVADSFSTETKAINLKFNLRMSKDYHTYFVNNTTSVAGGQIIMAILLDDGNCSTSVATTATGCITTAVNTGLHVRWYARWRYYDN